MRSRTLFILGFLFLVPEAALSAVMGQKGQVLPETRQARDTQLNHRSGIAQGLRLAGRGLVGYRLGAGRDTVHVLVFGDGFSMSVGANQFSSDSAVVWLEPKTVEFRGDTRTDFQSLRKITRWWFNLL